MPRNVGPDELDTEQATPRQPEPEGMSLEAAARAYEVSTSTLYRRLQAGTITGAKVSTGKVAEWRVTEQALEDAGYHRRQEAGPAAGDVGELAVTVRTLTEQLAAAYVERAEIEAEREAARVAVARLEAELDATRNTAARLEFDLAVARRRWWQRKPERPQLPPGDSPST